ncbi:MAG: WecB/TagA/CpsF family glycosyltransferase [Ruminococcaceae bacterium]|nr:WecB/TagA/CpsF family glycosyltransferase [Oscillospiraceae bacterium]
MAEKIIIRGVGVDNVTLSDAADICKGFLAEPAGHPKAVFTPNSEIIQACVEDESLYSVINSGDLVTPDGIGVIYASRILRRPLKAKCAGYELGLEMVRYAHESGAKIFFLGGKPGIAEAARDKLLEQYPRANFVGCHDGYFAKEGEENDRVIDEINQAQPDILYVCLGVPTQEKWILANRAKLTSVRLCLALGGSLDGYSGNVKRAPRIFIKLGLEWFYRLICQPSRIGRMMKLPKFLFGVIGWRLSGKYKTDMIKGIEHES